MIGASGYNMISATIRKTTLPGVDPNVKGKGIGMALQEAPLKKMYEMGARKVITNADRCTRHTKSGTFTIFTGNIVRIK